MTATPRPRNRPPLAFFAAVALLLALTVLA